MRSRGFLDSLHGIRVGMLKDGREMERKREMEREKGRRVGSKLMSALGTRGLDVCQNYDAFLSLFGLA